MADEGKDDVKALLARLTAAESERDQLRIKAARTDEAETKLTQLETQTRNEKITAHRATLMALFEAPIKDKKILPAVREQFKRVYRTDSDDVLSVTASDAEVFMRANPNPDAPKAPHTAGGSDPNDPADKAVEFARQRAREERASGGTKPADQVMVEAFQAQLRSNPDLAAAWKNAPGGNA